MTSGVRFSEQLGVVEGCGDELQWAGRWSGG